MPNAPTTLPTVGVLPYRDMRGAKDLNPSKDKIRSLQRVGFLDAFRIHWGTDAHFCTYQPSGPETEYTRCNAVLLSKVRAAGFDLLATMMVLDYDTTGHIEWTPELLGLFLQQLETASDEHPLLWNWSIFYTTRKGARFVYVLDKPLPVDVAQEKCRTLMVRWMNAGIKIDPTSAEWGRVFRLPHVVREGGQTWADPLITYIEQPDNRLDTDSLPCADPSALPQYAGTIDTDIGDRPDETEARALLEFVKEGGNRIQYTDWRKAAAKRLVGRDCYPCLFEFKPLAESGSRNNTLYSYVGQACTLLSPLQGTSPAHIYALFMDAVRQFESDQDTPDWLAVLWNHIGRCWGKEKAKQEFAAAELAARKVQTAAVLLTILAGMRVWCDHPALHQPDDEEAWKWACGRLVVSMGPSLFVMRPDGQYDTLAVTATQVGARIRALGMDGIIGVVDEKGKTLAAVDILSRHGTTVSQIEGIAGGNGGFGTIRDIDETHATLVIPLFSLNKNLTPCYDDDVDTWLSHLFGEHIGQGNEWIAKALAFADGATCALSLKTPPGVGKKMLAQGLAETLTRPALASAEDMISNNQYGLLESPYLVVNEGWPTGIPARLAADVFKHFVGGDGIRVSRKYMAPVMIKSPIRVLFTANDLSTVEVLGGEKDMSNESRDAIAERLMHLNCNASAKDWLISKGGKAFTAAPGRRWIAGDSGQPSDYIVARHFLWLHQQWDRTKRGSRLLMEGNTAEEMVRSFRTDSGVAPLVVESILRMLEIPARQRKGCVITPGHALYVSAAGVLDVFRTHIAPTVRENMTVIRIGKVLRSMTRQEHLPMVLPDAKDEGRVQWFELDCGDLIDRAMRDGRHSQVLEKLYADQVNGKKQILVNKDLDNILV